MRSNTTLSKISPSLIERFDAAQQRQSQIQPDNFLLRVERGLAGRRFIRKGDHAHAVDHFHFDIRWPRYTRFRELAAFFEKAIRDAFDAQLANGMIRLRSRRFIVNSQDAYSCLRRCR